MNSKIKKEMNLRDALELNEKTAEVLFSLGIGCLGCAFANAETLEEGLSAHGFTDDEIDGLVKEINNGA